MSINLRMVQGKLSIEFVLVGVVLRVIGNSGLGDWRGSNGNTHTEKATRC